MKKYTSILAAAILAVTTTAHAATFSWTGADGATWDTTATNWSGGTDPWNSTNGTTNTGNFTDAGSPLGAVVSGAVYANGIIYSPTGTGNFTISGGTINLAGTTPTVSVTTSTRALEISSSVAGSAGLVKSGAGTLTLSGSNSFTGNATISAGTLKVGHNSALGTGTDTNGLILNGGSIDLNGFSPTIGSTLVVGSNASATTTISGTTETLNLKTTGLSTVINASTGKTLSLSTNTTLTSTTGGASFFPVFNSVAGQRGTVVLEAGKTLALSSTAGTRALSALGTLTINGTLSNATAVYIQGGDSGSTLGVLNWNPQAVLTTPTLFVRLGGSVNIYNDKYGNLEIGNFGSGFASATATIKTGFTKGGIISMTFNAGQTNRLGVDDDTAAAISTTLTGAVNLSTSNATTTNEFFAGENDRLTLSGNITRTSGVATSVKISGPGTVVFSGSNNTYTDATLVNSGTLLINGNQTAATGAVTVQSGATLGGNGTIGGATTINGILAPGNSIGQLNITANTTWAGAATAGATTDWKFELGAGNSADLLNITGDFLRDTAAGNVFRFDFMASTATGTFKLVDWTGSTGFNSGDFTWNNLGGGNTVSGFNVDGATTALYVTVIPEPSTWALLAAGLTTLIVLRRRRQS